MADTKIGAMEGGALGATPVGTEQLWAQNAAGSIDYHWDLDDLSTWIQAELASATVGVQYRQATVVGYGVQCIVADGLWYLHIPPGLNGMDLVYAHIEVITAGVTGTMAVQIANVTDTVDMLSTKLTIDTTETGSDTAAAPVVIDGTKDDVVTNDVLRLDVDVIQTTAALGLVATLGFQLP